MMDHSINLHMNEKNSLGYLLSLKVFLCWCDPLSVEFRTMVDPDFAAQLM
jgi:hypothetical protein